MGTGSVNFTLTGASDGQIVALAAYQGTKLADITKLTYSSYQATTNTSNATAIALQFNVDRDLTDANSSWQGRIIYEPYQNNGGTVPLGTWNQWDAINGGAGKWWFSKASTVFGNNCPQSAPCTWSQIIALYPNIGIHQTLGAVVLKAGSGWATFDGNVDALTIGVNGTDTTYDFEHDAPLVGPPTSKNQCKNDGWKIFNNPTFKNQGACVSYVERQKERGDRDDKHEDHDKKDDRKDKHEEKHDDKHHEKEHHEDHDDVTPTPTPAD